MKKEFVVSEARLAESILEGEPTRERLRKLREENLEEGRDWTRNREGIFLTDGAAGRLVDLMGARTAGKEEGISDLKFQKEEEEGLPVVVRVERSNGKRIDVKYLGKYFAVRVRDNTNFLAGMVLPAGSLVEAGEGLWDFVGNLPRGRGRW